MKTYAVIATAIYNGYMTIDAESHEEAQEKAREMFSNENLQGFPNGVDVGDMHFDFGEVTIDETYVED